MHAPSPISLGINVDHVATLRQARGTPYPDPVAAARVAEAAGADSITVHLREDRRHIQERDVELLGKQPATRLNLEMAITGEMLELAVRTVPRDCCLVPERRQELTTEGGLDVRAQFDAVRDACSALVAAGIRVALFIDPDPDQVDAAREAGAPVVELHTGAFADAGDDTQRAGECERVRAAARYAVSQGLEVHAGHGLNYENVHEIAAIMEIVELNIGHAVVAEAVFTGLDGAVRRMKQLMDAARAGAGGQRP